MTIMDYVRRRAQESAKQAQAERERAQMEAALQTLGVETEEVSESANADET